MDRDGPGQVVLGALAPHPPLLIPEVGGDLMLEVENTRLAMERLALAVKEIDPDVVVVISPHGPLLPKAIGIWAMGKLRGDFAQFRAPEVALAVENDLELLAALLDEGQALSYPLRGVDENMLHRYGYPPELDYATLIPLYYLEKAGVKKPVLPMGMGLLRPRELYKFGIVLRRAVERTGRRAVVIASGDLSHRLTMDAPAGYSKSGSLFDRTLWELLGKGDIEGILNIDAKLLEDAGECGYRSLVMMLGCWDGRSIKTVPLSYEGPFGVGYGVCVIHQRGLSIPSLDEKKEGSQNRLRHPLVELARRTVEAIARGERPPSPKDVDLPEDLPSRAAVFVTLEKDGHLRGCIGTLEPVHSNLAEEVIANARQAAFGDPRFPTVKVDELGRITYSVDVLGEPEPAADERDLDPKVFGVIVRAGRRVGVLLPDIEGIDTAQVQVDIARRKAGIGPNEPVELYRFRVERYT
ncbi:MAG: AmmeMemoRadiSam system protein A [Firmicutes bacterium]|nr:AmmeMemoRadiSam system protein A [Bacillota bacterium]